MKKHILKIAAIFTATMLLASCSKTPEQPSDSSEPESVISEQTEKTYIVNSNLYWNFSDLYDNAEIEGKSGEIALDSLGGETLKLFSKDGEQISEWSALIEDGQQIEKYDKDGNSILKLTVKVPVSENDKILSAVTESDASNQTDDPQTGSQESDQSKDADGKTEIKLLAPSGSQALANAVSEYEKKHSNIKITIIEKDFDKRASVINFLSDKKQSGDYFDAIILGGKYLDSAANAGLIKDISEYGAKELSSFFTESCFTGVSNGEKVYGLPLEGTVTCFTANPDILASLGLKNPDNFDQLIDTCKQIAAATDTICPLGISFSEECYNSIGELFFSSIRSRGCTFEQERSAAFDAQDYEGFIESLSKLKNDKLVSDNWSFSQLIGGKTAFGFTKNISYKNLFGTSAKFNFTSFPLSKAINENYVSALDLSALCVTDTGNAEKQQAAYDFVKSFALSAKICAEYCSARSTLPALKKAQANELYNTDNWKNYIVQLEQSQCITNLEQRDVLLRYVYDAVQSSLSENGNLSADFKKLIERFNARLSR